MSQYVMTFRGNLWFKLQTSGPRFMSQRSKLLPPYETGASFWQRAFFTSIYPLLVRGYETPLEHADLYQLPLDQRAGKFAREINTGLHYDTDTPVFSADEVDAQCCTPQSRFRFAAYPFCCFARNVPPLFMVLLKMTRPNLLRAAFFRLTADSLTVMNPLILSELIRASMGTASVPALANFFGATGYLYFLAVFFFLFAFLSCTLMQHHNYNALRSVLLIRTGLISAFYRKTMRLTPSARSRLTTGLIMTMISTDSSRLSDMCMMLHHIWACPFLISVSMIFLIQFIGVAALGGLGWLVFVLALETVFARLSLIINRKALKATDARLEIVGQVLKNIRIVKLYGWQSAFLGKILDSRQLEVNLIRVFAFTKAMITMLLQVTPVMVALCTFSMYTYLNPDRPLTAVQAFTTLALFNILRQPLTQMPKVLSNIVDAMSCFPRVNQLMDAEELPGCTPYSQLQNLVDAVEQVELGPDSTVPVAKRAASVKDILSEVKNVQPALPEGSIYIPGYDFSYEYPSAASFLPNVQLDIKPGSLVMLVGPVASGKSTLMLSLLGELHTTQNSTLKSNKTVSGKIAYLSQTSWIMNDTVRNNICFGMDYDPIWYARVIASCALESDLASLAAGDMTEIGERGVTLSGGQKARVALARAVYSNADVYLLDSPLSALDVHVGQFVLEQCLCGVLKEKTIVLITHDLPLTRMADQIIVMQNAIELESHEQPSWKVRIAETGTYDELVHKPHGVLARHLQNVLSLGSAGGSLSPVNRRSVQSTPFQPSAQRQPTPTQSLSRKPYVQNRMSQSNWQLQLSMSHDGLVDFGDDYFDDSVDINDVLMNGNGEIVVDSSSSSVPLSQELVSDKVAVENAKNPIVIAQNSNLQDAKIKGKLMQKEKHFKGANSKATYMAFIEACGTPKVIGLLIMLFCAPLTNALNDLWLSAWASVGSSSSRTSATSSIAISMYSSWLNSAQSSTDYLKVYAYFALTAVLITLVASSLTVQVGLSGSQRLHNRMINALLHAPMAFFDTTPVGRIIHRCSADVEGLDVRLSQQLLDLFLLASLLCVNLFMICLNLPWFLIAFAPAVYVFYRLQNLFRRSSRELKRLYSISKSPIFASFNEMMDGVTTIRAFRAEPRLLFVNSQQLDHNNEAWHAWQGINRWIAFHLDLLGAVILLVVALIVVTLKNSMPPGMVGMMVTYGIALTGRMNHLVRQSLETEQDFSSVERILEYTNLVSEDVNTQTGVEIITHDATLQRSLSLSKKTKTWPHSGAIEFKNISVRYRKGLDLVIRNFSASIRAKEKIGICGRTGAGKSSLLSLLFRLVECEQGHILIDGRDIVQVDLEFLRRSLAIIPQDPVLFEGSIRFNVDPLGQCTDADIWAALKRCQIDNNITKLPGQLNALVSECGSGFSVGEKQLLCMARALLRHSHILVMDEATASIDYHTDSIIQNMIQNEFRDRTVLTIAHRLNTILWMDRVMVLEQGRLVEFDSPDALMQKPDGVFRSMISDFEAGKA